ncbi:hypothetical protein GHT06_009473 [Daphnia sinensis]|uniref:GH18 domain-containing protein n=1 Tax=Daphnia sinensis TaxID=1820382 RepID=A0AAD5PZA1_9CRUS|nr:hypothetical protein GHT06_009473 [Daphnia sinensis]
MLKSLSLCLILACSYATGLDLDADVNSHNKVVACYVAGWSAYRPNNGAFTVDNIDPMLCTHIIYAFAGLDNVTYSIKSLDSFLDTEEGGGRGQYKKVMNFKKKQPRLKVTIAIGGWNEGSGKYSDMAETPENRRLFINSVLAFIKKHGFDGLDMDWEYPGSRVGSRPVDRENFALLLKEMRTEFDKSGLILTAAIGAAPQTINRAYDVPAITQHLHYIHIMAYDYHGSWDFQIGHNAPLRLPVNSSTVDLELRLSVEDTITYLLKLGASPEKLVVGIPFYGRTFTLVDRNLRDIGSASNGTGFQGPYTREDGFLGYNEICKELTTKKEGNEWVEQWDDVAQVPYMYNGEKWVSFDNQRSVAIKARYAFNQGLGGLMVWAIDNDDFMPECSNVRYPLLRAINAELKAASIDSMKPGQAPVTPKSKDSNSDPNSGHDKKPGQTSDTTSSEDSDNDIEHGHNKSGQASGIKVFSLNLLLCVLTPVIFTFSILH